MSSLTIEHPYATDSAESLVGMTKRTRRPWRRCASCYGVCHWHDEAWVCDGCGDEWYADHGGNYAAPGDCPKAGCEFRAGHLAEHPHGREAEPCS